MKGFFCISVLVLAAVCQGRIIDEGEEELNRMEKEAFQDVVETIYDGIQFKCNKTGHELSKEKYDDAVEDSRKCFRTHVPKSKHEIKSYEDLYSEFCSRRRGSLRQCLEQVAHVAEDCFNEEEKYLPDFVLAAFDGVFDLLCEHQGQIMDEVTNDATMQCLEKIFGVSQKMSKCARRFFVFNADFEKHTLIEKSDLCHDLDNTKECMEEFITIDCNDNSDFHNLVNKIHKAITAPCLEEPKTI